MCEYINAFPGYEYVWDDKEKKYINRYRGVNISKGGWVYSEPGIHTNVALLDVASMHPASIIALNKLGKYTQRYADLRLARVLIKHGKFEEAAKLFDGKLAKYLTDKDNATSLSQALKLPLNAFFGIGYAGFENPARDSRDVNNIVALRGALFMKTLFDEVTARGFRVVHNKTDSVKIPNATNDIITFVQEFARKYGYEMEHEATYERMCLLDKAQYVAAYMRPEECEKRYGYIPGDNNKHFKKHDHPWTTTGDAFQHPYIFKTLFSGEPIEFEDRCEFKQVKTAMYLDMHPGIEDAQKELDNRIYNATIKGTKKKPKPLSDAFSGFFDNSALERYISDGHDYRFVGRVGNFYPIRPGSGGGELLRLNDRGGYDSVNGTKGYFWMEAEKVRALRKEDEYDPRYFKDLIDKAIESVTNLNGAYDPSRFDRFIDLSRPYEELSQDETKEEATVEQDQAPHSPTLSAAAMDVPWIVPCGDSKYNTCMECPHCHDDVCDKGYSLATFDDELPF